MVETERHVDLLTGQLSTVIVSDFFDLLDER